MFEMEPAVGFEPTTRCLRGSRSTGLSYAWRNSCSPFALEHRMGARRIERDLDLFAQELDLPDRLSDHLGRMGSRGNGQGLQRLTTSMSLPQSEQMVMAILQGGTQ